MNMITAVCEIHDQCCGIQEVRYIENTEKAMVSFENEMEDVMDVYGYRITFYKALMPDFDYDVPCYRWMDENKHLEIERP